MLTVTVARATIVLAGIVFVYLYSRADRGRGREPGFWATYVLVSLALLSVALHLDLTLLPQPSIRVHEHDIFHYYMGSKYSHEVGYLDLYESVAVADAENRPGPSRGFLIRRMEDYRLEGSPGVIARGDEYRARFSAARWEEFKLDVAAFRARLEPRQMWLPIFRDNGYNATPAWNMVARWLTHRISVRWPPGMHLLAGLDLCLLALIVAVLWRSFGERVALLAIIFVGSMAVMAPGTIRGAMLRLDWLALMVLATCALKSRRYKTAGALMAGAGMARIFPLVFVFGLGAKWAWSLATTRKLDRRYLAFFVTLALVVVVLFAGSCVDAGGLASWQAFVTKIRLHDTQMSTLRVGFKPLLLAGVAPLIDDWPVTASQRARRFGEIEAAWWVALALVVAASFFAVRRLEDYEALAYGYVLFYFLTAPTFYYQVVLLVPALLFLPKLGERTRAHGMALLFGVSLPVYLLWALKNFDGIGGDLEWGRFDYRISLALSAMLLAVAIYIIAWSRRTTAT